MMKKYSNHFGLVLSLVGGLVGLGLSAQTVYAAADLVVTEEVATTDQRLGFNKNATLVDETGVLFRATIENSGDSRAHKVTFTNDYDETLLANPNLVSLKVDNDGDGTYDLVLDASQLDAIESNSGGIFGVDFDLISGFSMGAAVTVQFTYQMDVIATSTGKVVNTGVVAWSNSATGAANKSNSDSARVWLIVSGTDTDGDTIDDTVETGDTTTGSTPTDTDADGTPDYEDTDSDGDGTADSTEGTGDTDGDGTVNYLDSTDDSTTNTNTTTNSNTNTTTNSNSNTNTTTNSNTNSNTNTNSNSNTNSATSAPTTNTTTNTTSSGSTLAETGGNNYMGMILALLVSGAAFSGLLVIRQRLMK